MCEPVNLAAQIFAGSTLQQGAHLGREIECWHLKELGKHCGARFWERRGRHVVVLKPDLLRIPVRAHSPVRARARARAYVRVCPSVCLASMRARVRAAVMWVRRKACRKA